MSLHQYIGARYVPIFYQNSLDPTSTEWEANVTYEPMTWVSTLNGNMYLSKKTVPANAGAPASTPEYWMEAGQFNAYIQGLQDQIDDMNDANVPGSLQAQISNIDTVELPPLQSDVSTIKNKTADNWIIVTDSYGGLYPDITGSTFIEQMRALSGRDATSLVGLAYSGDGFINNGGSGNTFLQSFTAWTTAQSADYLPTVSKVAVVAGRNDWNYSQSAIDGAINAFASYVKNNYPNAEFYIGFIANGSNTYNGTRAQQYTVYKAFVENQNSIYLSGVEAILKNTDLMAADYIHPNADGRAQLAKYILQAMETGSAHVNYPRHKVTITPTLANAAPVFNAVEFYEEVIDGKVVLDCANIGAIDFTGSSLQVNGSHNEAYGICDAKYIKFPVNGITLPMDFCSLRTSESGNLQDVAGVYTANISFNVDGNLYFNLFGAVGAGPYNRTVTYVLFRNRPQTSIPSVIC